MSPFRNVFGVSILDNGADCPGFDRQGPVTSELNRRRDPSPWGAIPVAGVDAGLHLLGEDVAGHDCVDPNATGSEIRGKNRGQMADRRLGGSVGVEGERGDRRK